MTMRPTARNTNLHLTIDDARCQVCDDCAAKRKCRIRAIRMIDPGEPPILDPTYCLGCRICVAACPRGAVVEYSED